MSPQLIVMLTHHDTTVPDAAKIFDECRETQAQNWGFKDVGLPHGEMKRLAHLIKEAGKTAFLEVVRYSEEECLESAQLAVDCGFDYLMGTVYHPSVGDSLRGRPLKYLPFCGKVSGHPSVLEGSISEIVAQAQALSDQGVAGFDILSYRYTGDPVALARHLIQAVRLPVVIAGSIDSLTRLDVVKELNPWGYTIGGAFFEHAFVPEGSFGQQIDLVLDYMRDPKESTK